MDQWTSRSINFLIDGPPVVKMRIKNHVDPRNNEAVYENFCCAVEALTKALHKVSLEETELCLFSKGGTKPSSLASPPATKWRLIVLVGLPRQVELGGSC